MVCSGAMSSSCVWLQILFCSCVNESTLFSFLLSLLPENGSFPKIFIKKQARWLNGKTIIRNSQSILHSTLLMDNCIGHFEVARETGSSCIMGMFRRRYGSFFGAYEVAQETGSKFFPSTQIHDAFRHNTLPVLIDRNFKMAMTRDGQLP